MSKILRSFSEFTIGKYARWIAIGLLLLFWVRLLDTAIHKSVTFDEIIHILDGALIWQKWPLYSVVQNPPLVNSLIGLPVHLAFHPHLPANAALWETGDWLRISQQFMWLDNTNGLQLIFAGRLTVMGLALLTGALVYRWAAWLFRRRLAGLLALFLVSFDPTILAHGSLATTDMGAAFFLALAAFMVWTYWSRDRRKRFYALASVSLGLALSAKFTGMLALIALVIIAGYRIVVEQQTTRQARRTFAETAGWILFSIVVLFLLYRLQFSTLLDDLLTQQAHQLEGHSTFLLGQTSLEGWWYYFPVVFLIKTPLAVFALLGLASLWFWAKRGWRNWSLVWLLILAGGVLAAGLTSRVNIGYRYLLPMLPLLFVFIGSLAETGKEQVLSRLRLGGKPLRPIITALYLMVYLLVAWFALASLVSHPNYLAYFNQIAGGPDNGWRWVVDSNIDWGQDIQDLGLWLTENGVDRFQAAWLGTAPLEAYGISGGQPMAVWPLGHEERLFDPFYPDEPAPGIYALSVTQLQGPYLKDRDRFAWFREREPLHKAGYSIFVYDVPDQGQRVGLGLSGIGVSHIQPGDYRTAFGTNDLQPRWFDARTSFLWPGGGGAESAWTAVGDGNLINSPLLQALYPAAGPAFVGERFVDGRSWGYRLYHWPDSAVTAVINSHTPSVFTTFGWTSEEALEVDNWEEDWHSLEMASFGGSLQLLAYQMPAPTGGLPLELLTFWRVQHSINRPLKIFVHLLDGDGNMVAQHDGLDVLTTELQIMDEFAQLHTIPLPPDLPAGDYAIQLGLYDAESGVRLSLDQAPSDRILLGRLATYEPGS